MRTTIILILYCISSTVVVYSQCSPDFKQAADSIISKRLQLQAKAPLTLVGFDQVLFDYQAAIYLDSTEKEIVRVHIKFLDSLNGHIELWYLCNKLLKIAKGTQYYHPCCPQALAQDGLLISERELSSLLRFESELRKQLHQLYDAPFTKELLQ